MRAQMSGSQCHGEDLRRIRSGSCEQCPIRWPEPQLWVSGLTGTLSRFCHSVARCAATWGKTKLRCSAARSVVAGLRHRDGSRCICISPECPLNRRSWVAAPRKLDNFCQMTGASPTWSFNSSIPCRRFSSQFAGVPSFGGCRRSNVTASSSRQP